MAETIRIEIPIEAIDNTDPELQNVINKLSKLSNAAKQTTQTTSRTQTGTKKMASGVKEVGSAADKTTSSVKKSNDTVSKFDKTAQKTQRSLSKWAKEKYQILLEAKDKISPVLTTLGSGLKNLGSKAWTVTMKAVDFVTAPVRGILNLLRNPLLQVGAVLGVSIGIKDTIDTYKNFEAAMSTVQATSGATSSELERLTAKAKEMGATTKFTATEAAEGFNYMAMAGWKTEDMLNGIEGILNLAAASGEDLGTTSDIVTDALTAFKLSAEDASHFSDVLAAASSNANTNVSMMGETFKYAGAMAGTLGYSIEDVGVMVGLMANSGIKASSAGTQLNSIMTRLSTNTNGAQDAIKALGIDFFDSSGNARDLSDVIDQLREATKGYNDEQKSNLANTIAGTRAQSGLLSILNASEADYKKLTEAINNADGAAEKMADTRMDNLEGSLTLLQSAADGVKISFGQRLAPYIKNFANWLTDQMPNIEQGLSDFMDFFDKKVEHIKRKWGEITGTDEWKNADIFGKVKIAWDEFIANPFKEWWNGAGKGKVMEIAGNIGNAIGSGLKFGILTLLGIDVAGAVDEGASVGVSFAKGFAEGIDFEKISARLMEGLGNVVQNAFKILPGGDPATLSSFLSAGLLMKLGSPIFSLGKGIMNAAPTIGTLLGSASAGTGLLGNAAMFAINTGAGNLAGGASMSAGALSALGLAEGAGAIAGAAGLIHGGMDLYTGFTTDDEKKAAAYKKAGAVEVGGTLAGAGAGAAAGAAIGAIFGGVGAVPGALIGAGIGAIGSWIAGNKIKEDYEKEVEEMQREQEKAQKIFQATGLSMDEVKFKNKALTEMMNDSEVSAAEFAAAFQEECANVMKDAFGDIHLSLEEVKKLASEITFADMADDLEEFATATANTESSLNTLRQSVTAMKKENWKVGLGMQLTETEQDNYKKSIEDFVEASQSYIEDNHYEATVALNLLTKGQGSTTGLDSMYEGMKTSVDTIGSEMGEYIQKALADGILDADEMEVIEAYQQKIADITNKLSSARNEAELQAIGIKYSGAELDAESFQAMQEELKLYSEQAQQQYDEALTITLTNLNLELQEGAITQDEYDKAVKEATEGYQAQLDEISVRINDFNLDAIVNAYDEQLNGILPYFEGTTQEKLQQAINNAMISHPDVASWSTADVIGWLGLDSLPTEVATPLASQLIQSAQANTEATRQELIDSYKECIPTADEIYAAIDWDSFTFNDKDAMMKLLDPTFGQGASFDLASSDKAKTFAEYYGSGWEEVARATSENIAQTMQDNLDPEALQTVMDDYFTNAMSQMQTPSFENVMEQYGPISNEYYQQIVNSMATGASSADYSGISAAFGAGIGSAIQNTDMANINSAITTLKSSTDAAVNTAYSAGVSTTMPVDVTLDYNILNPTKTFSLTGEGVSGSKTVTVKANAMGGFVGGKQLSWVGEEGPEAIIPLIPSRRSRALNLYEQVGEMLGIGRHADGGIISGSNSLGNLIDGNLFADAIRNAPMGFNEANEDIATPIPTQQLTGSDGVSQSGGSSIQVSVSMTPEFNISGSDGESEENIMAVIRRHMKEMADELGGEIAERLEDVFSNMPLKEA